MSWLHTKQPGPFLASHYDSKLSVQDQGLLFGLPVGSLVTDSRDF